MIKIGIITCHDVYNFGATLQAYALSNYISKNYCKCKIINYKPKYLYRLIDFMKVDAPKWKITFWRRWIYRIYMIPFHLTHLNKFIKYKLFNIQFLNLTKKYCNVKDLKECSEFDLYICGSDQIWNSCPYPCGEDPAFFLSFVPNENPCISYAASFGGKNLSEKGIDNIKKYLHRFAAISVREQSGVNILNKYNIKSVTVLDPVFLLNKIEWRELKSKLELPEKYILAYGYDNTENFYSAIEKYKQKLKYPVIFIMKEFKNAGPREFLTLIDNASLVITTSFHALAFSIIFNTPFITVETNHVDLFERIKSLLSALNLTHRIYQNKYIDINIDFDLVKKRLLPLIDDSKSFLEIINDYAK